jgi:group II intron reverse transcriptase/maturase
MQTDTALRRLGTLSTLARAGKRSDGLFRLLTCRLLWTEGLERIKRNKGAQTPGIDGSSVLGLGETDIEALIQALMEGSYRPMPVRRVYIPKTNGKLRPLGIPTAKDRLVHEVVRSILNRIYEPIFSDHSHGFRKGRSCHTALTEIRKTWTGVKWLVEVDVKGYFDNIDHTVLLELLERRIDDKKFLSLIRSMLRAGFLEQWRFNETHSGTPQGGIASPLLANIYLHELDVFVEQYKANFNKGDKRSINREYRSWSLKAKRLRARVNEARAAGREEEATLLLAKHDECRARMQEVPSVDPMDPNFKKLVYVRYADDFLLGVIGSKEDARCLMRSVEAFLTDNLKLEVSSEKSGIRHASKGAGFLGYDVWKRDGSRKMTKHVKDGHSGLQRFGSGAIKLGVPHSKVQAFAKRHGYGHLDLCRGIHRAHLLRRDDASIAELYNSEIRGFANYYALAYDVKRKIRKLYLIWQASLFKTLAAKHRTTTTRVARQCRIGPGTYVVRWHANGKWKGIKVWAAKNLMLQPRKSWWVDSIGFSNG